jgi:hypothetical protein
MVGNHLQDGGTIDERLAWQKGVRVLAIRGGESSIDP